MKVFISGPISGLDKKVYTANFKAAEDMLGGYQLTAVNPVIITGDLPEGSDWKKYMKMCIAALLDCDAIYMLKDWPLSKGATLEHTIAQGFGLLTMYES